MAEIEVWKEIPAYPNYKVSNLGRVYSACKSGRVLKTGIQSQGYAQVCLCKGGIKSTYRLHILICRAFKGEPPNDSYQVNHKDGNKLNNVATNLEWVTGSDNIKHAYDTGLLTASWNNAYGADHPKSIPIEQYTLDGIKLAAFDSLFEAQKATGIIYTSISKCLHGHYAKAGGYKWKFAEQA